MTIEIVALVLDLQSELDQARSELEQAYARIADLERRLERSNIYKEIEDCAWELGEGYYDEMKKSHPLDG